MDRPPGKPQAEAAELRSAAKSPLRAAGRVVMLWPVCSVEKELARARAAQRRAAQLLELGADRLAARPRASAWCVAEHLAHVWLAEREILALCARLAREPDAPRGGGPTFAGRVVLCLRRIPRGRGKAPERVVPRARPTLDELRALRAEAERALTELELLAPLVARAPGRVPHHVLGGFDARRWLRYVSIHTEHHLRMLGG